MLIKEDIHLFEVDGVMKCVEQRLFQVIREVCGQEAVRITDRCIIQVLEEGEEEGDSVYWSLLSWSGLAEIDRSSRCASSLA